MQSGLLCLSAINFSMLILHFLHCQDLSLVPRTASLILKTSCIHSMCRSLWHFLKLKQNYEPWSLYEHLMALKASVYWYKLRVTCCSPMTTHYVKIRKKTFFWDFWTAHFLKMRTVCYFHLFEQQQEYRETGREREGVEGKRLRLRDGWRDSDRGLSDKDLCLQPYSWQSFSPRFLRLYLLLGKEQIMTRGWSMRYSV